MVFVWVFFVTGSAKYLGLPIVSNKRGTGEGTKPVVPAAEQLLSGRSLIPLQYIAGSSRSYRCLIASSQYSL